MLAITGTPTARERTFARLGASPTLHSVRPRYIPSTPPLWTPAFAGVTTRDVIFAPMTTQVGSIGATSVRTVDGARREQSLVVLIIYLSTTPIR